MKVDADNWADVVSGAQKIWIETWGPIRESGNSRRNFSSDRDISNGNHMVTETEWRRKRKATLDQEVKALPEKSRSQVLHDAMEKSSECWNTSMQEKENTLQQQQSDDRAWAVLQGEALLPSEVSQHTQDDGVTLMGKRVANDKEHDRKRQKKLAVLTRPELIVPVGLTIHLQSDISHDVRAICEAHIQENGGTFVTHDVLHEAVLFVADNLAKVHSSIQVVAHMLGGDIVCPNYLLSNGVKGARLSYKPAVKTKRTIYISVGFIAQYGELVGCIAACVDAASSNWRWCTSLDRFRRYMLELVTCYECIIIVQAYP